MGELFGRPHATPPGFENCTRYVFFLRDETAGELETGASAPLDSDLSGRLAAAQLASPASPPPADTPPTFHPNMVVTRERTAAASLEAYVEQQNQEAAQRGVQWNVEQQASITIGGQPAHRRVVRMTITEPVPAELTQVHVVLLCDGWAYNFVGTTLEKRAETDLPRFDAFVRGWSPPPCSAASEPT